MKWATQFLVQKVVLPRVWVGLFLLAKLRAACSRFYYVVWQSFCFTWLLLRNYSSFGSASHLVRSQSTTFYVLYGLVIRIAHS